MAQGLTPGLGATRSAPGGIMAGGFDAMAPLRSELKKARMWLIGTGIFGLLAGAAAIAVPVIATITMTIFIGWLLVAAGVVMAVHAWTQRAEGRNWSRVAQAALSILIGLYLVVFTGPGALSLTLMLVLWFIGTGGIELWAAYQLRGMPGAGLMAFNGVVSVILAALITADLPSSAAWAIGLLVGVNLVFWGVRALIAAQMLKRLLPG